MRSWPPKRPRSLANLKADRHQFRIMRFLATPRDFHAAWREMCGQFVLVVHALLSRGVITIGALT